MSGMANETDQVRGELNYLAVLVSLFGAIVLQSVVKPDIFMPF